MTLLPQLESELLTAHARLTKRSALWRRLALPIGALGNAAVLLAAVTAVAVAAFVLLAAGHRHPGGHKAAAPPPAASGPLLPSNPTRRQRAEESYLYAAWAAVGRQDRACALISEQLNGSPTISQGTPSRSLLGILGVLRRPARPADRLPVRITYHPYRRDPNGSLPPLRGIYVRYIRRARWRYGAGYYVVPAADANPIRPLPARCYAAQQIAVQRALGRIPAHFRAGTLALEPRFLAQLRARTTPAEGVCLAALNDTGNGDGCGGGDTVTDIEQGHTLTSGGPTGVGVVYGIVPDGVATVRLRYPGRSFTVRAISNVFILPNPGQRLPDDGFPNTIMWRAPSGTILKTISSP